MNLLETNGEVTFYQIIFIKMSSLVLIFLENSKGNTYTVSDGMNIIDGCANSTVLKKAVLTETIISSQSIRPSISTLTLEIFSDLFLFILTSFLGRVGIMVAFLFTLI